MGPAAAARRLGRPDVTGVEVTDDAGVERVVIGVATFCCIDVAPPVRGRAMP